MENLNSLSQIWTLEYPTHVYRFQPWLILFFPYFTLATLAISWTHQVLSCHDAYLLFHHSAWWAYLSSSWNASLFLILFVSVAISPPHTAFSDHFIWKWPDTIIFYCIGLFISCTALTMYIIILITLLAVSYVKLISSTGQRPYLFCSLIYY